MDVGQDCPGGAGFLGLQFRDWLAARYPEYTMELMAEQMRLEIQEFRLSNNGYVGANGVWLGEWIGDCSWLYFWFGFALNLNPVELLTTRPVGNGNGWRLRPGRSSELKHLRDEIQHCNSTPVDRSF